MTFSIMFLALLIANAVSVRGDVAVFARKDVAMCRCLQDSVVEPTQTAFLGKGSNQQPISLLAIATAAGIEPWHLAPPGSHACDAGTPAPQGECQKLVKSFATKKGKTPGRTLQVGQGGTCNDGGWGQVPAGCSAQSGGDWAAHFKKGPGMGAGCINVAYQLVCSGPSPTHETKTIVKDKWIHVEECGCDYLIGLILRIMTLIQEATVVEKNSEKAVSLAKQLQETLAELKAAKHEEAAAAAAQIAAHLKEKGLLDALAHEKKEIEEKKEAVKEQKLAAAAVVEPAAKAAVVGSEEELEEEIEEEEVEATNKKEEQEAVETEATAKAMEAFEASSNEAEKEEEFKSEEKSLEMAKELSNAEETGKLEMKALDLESDIAATPPLPSKEKKPDIVKVNEIKQAEVHEVSLAVKIVKTAEEQTKETKFEEEKADKELEEVKAKQNDREDQIASDMDTINKLKEVVKDGPCRPCRKKLRKAKARIAKLQG